LGGFFTAFKEKIMSLGPTTVPKVFDLFNGLGTMTGTQAGPAVTLPPGKKAIQVSIVTSATLTVKIQNSVDRTNWFDVSSSTVAPGIIYETDSTIPHWRVNVTAHTTSGTGSSAPIVAQIAQLLL
jgi:hypothetical protein